MEEGNKGQVRYLNEQIKLLPSNSTVRHCILWRHLSSSKIFQMLNYIWHVCGFFLVGKRWMREGNVYVANLIFYGFESNIVLLRLTAIGTHRLYFRESTSKKTTHNDNIWPIYIALFFEKSSRGRWRVKIKLVPRIYTWNQNIVSRIDTLG